MSYVKCALGVVGTLGLLLSSQRAGAVTLQDLVDAGGSLVHGNEIYSGFTSGGTLPASEVTVNFTDAGVQFAANWNTLTPGANSSVISYDVTSAPDANGNPTGIDLAKLSFGGQVVINNGTASVGETLTDASSGHDYSMQVFYAGQNGANNNLQDSVNILPSAARLHVVKSIDVAATGPNAFASLNFVENTYASISTFGGPGVPEPMSLTLIPIAIGALALRKRISV